MRKLYNVFLILTLIIIIGCTFTACGNNNDDTASFVPEVNYTLTVTKTWGGYVMGSVSVLGGLTSGSATFSSGDNVNLLAYANYGYKFDGWYVNGLKVWLFSNYSFTMSAGNKTIQARFVEQ